MRIGFALADALDFLHRQGLTHRDIKPQNIIFVNDTPKLADVALLPTGIARRGARRANVAEFKCQTK